MVFTVKNVVDEVRPLVADTQNPYRWTDAQLKAKINEGVQEIFTMRPDALTSVEYTPPEELTSMYDEVPLRALFKSALNYYTSSSLLMERSSDKSLRAQGMELRKLFLALMGV